MYLLNFNRYTYMCNPHAIIVSDGRNYYFFSYRLRCDYANKNVTAVWNLYQLYETVNLFLISTHIVHLHNIVIQKKLSSL